MKDLISTKLAFVKEHGLSPSSNHSKVNTDTIETKNKPLVKYTLARDKPEESHRELISDSNSEFIETNSHSNNLQVRSAKSVRPKTYTYHISDSNVGCGLPATEDESLRHRVRDDFTPAVRERDRRGN